MLPAFTHILTSSVSLYNPIYPYETLDNPIYPLHNPYIIPILECCGLASEEHAVLVQRLAEMEATGSQGLGSDV